MSTPAPPAPPAPAAMQATLITEPHLEAPDDFYEALIDTHRELSAKESHALNARLILLLANHIGSLAVLQQALAAAREGAAKAATDPTDPPPAGAPR